MRKDVFGTILDNYVAELKMLEKTCDALYAAKYPNVMDYFTVSDEEIDKWFEDAKKNARDNAAKMMEVQHVA